MLFDSPPCGSDGNRRERSPSFCIRSSGTTIKRRVYHKLLCNQMCNCPSSSKTSLDYRVRMRCFDNGCIRFFLMTLPARIGEVYIFSALGTFALFFIEFMLNGVGLDVLDVFELRIIKEQRSSIRSEPEPEVFFFEICSYSFSQVNSNSS